MLHMSIHVSTYVCVLIPTYLLEYCAVHNIPPTIVAWVSTQGVHIFSN